MKFSFPALSLCAAFATLLATAPLAAQASPSHHGNRATSCQSCGTVISTRSYQQQGCGTGVGAVGGAVVGGLLGNQIGGGNGRTLATVAGAVGGGYAGNSIEKHARSTLKTQVRVRMSNGGVRSFTEAGASHRQAGQRVKVVNGRLIAR